MKKLVIKNIKGLVQVSNESLKRRSGKEMSLLPVLNDSYLIISDGLVYDFNSMTDYTDPEDDFQVIDAGGCFVFPCWIDSHTHIVFADSREAEFVMKIKGAGYEEIFNAGGGILNSAQKLSLTAEDILFNNTLKRLDEMIMMGTGAVEIKSGYGLSTESELKILRVIKEIKKISPIPVKSTFLGAHAIPLEYKNNREKYISLIIDEMLPIIKNEQLADYIDVFCDKSFFTVEETEKILDAGYKYSLKPKIHANELGLTGGVQVGVKYNAVSVDHLEIIGDEELNCLLNSRTMPVVLPSTSFFMNIPYAPARKMIDNGLSVAIASDYNPGTSPSGNLNFSLSLACIKMKLIPEEAINALTVNAAFALEVQEKAGAIVKGFPANIFITKPIPSFSYLPYFFGGNLIDKVIIGGEIYNSKKILSELKDNI